MIGIGIGILQKRRIRESITTSMLLTSTGTGAGVSTLRLQVSSDMTVTLDGTGKFYTDEAGTIGESSSWTITAGALRTIYLKVPSGSANLSIPNRNLVTKFGEWNSIYGWVSVSVNGASMTITPSDFPNITTFIVARQLTILGKFPDKVIDLRLEGGGALTWNDSNNLPPLLQRILIEGSLLSWVNSTPLPNTITYVYIASLGMNWTGLSIGSGSNIIVLFLSNYRVDKMSSADMVTLLTQMTNRTGTLPAAVTINDYADYTSPPIEVTNAVTLLKSTKSITTVNLGA